MSDEGLLDSILGIENDVVEREREKQKKPWWRKIFKNKNKKRD